MTATPIPRTAAMLVYGDLDRSELHEMPPGRTPVTTEVIGPAPSDRRVAYDRLREQVAAGRQAYVVCPLVEGSPKIEAKAATEELEELVARRAGGPSARAAARPDEVGGEGGGDGLVPRPATLDVLVATTVIEVGVDVPNATVMIVEDADRFGLSQLHQLRGRVGRGAAESWCYLFADPSTPDGTAPHEAMEESTDGFVLAERDLEIRGSGQVFGERQAGLGDLKLGRLPATRSTWSSPGPPRSASSTTIPAWRATRRSPRRSRTCWVRTSSSSSRAEEDTVSALRRVAVTLVAGLSLIAAGCGSDGSKATGATSTSTSTASTSTSTTLPDTIGRPTQWRDETARWKRLAPTPFSEGPTAVATTWPRSTAAGTRRRSAR